MTKSIPVEIKSVNEPWCQIQLADGSAITMRVVVLGVEAIYDDNGNHMVMPDGQLAYSVSHSVAFKTTSSPHILEQVRASNQRKGLN